MSDSLNKDKFQKEVRDALKEVLSEKESADRLAKIEEVLVTAERTISELSDGLSRKEEELVLASEENEQLKEQVEALSAKALELEEKLSEAEKRSGELEERASNAENELTAIAKDRLTEVRMNELREASVAQTGEKYEKQTQRVREMSDEEFATYKEERIDLLKEVEERVKKEVASANEPDDDPNEATEKVNVAPPDLEKAKRESAAAAAALNIEVPGEDLRGTYKEFANYMAEEIAKSYRNENK